MDIDDRTTGNPTIVDLLEIHIETVSDPGVYPNSAAGHAQPDYDQIYDVCGKVIITWPIDGDEYLTHCAESVYEYLHANAIGDLYASSYGHYQSNLSASITEWTITHEYAIENENGQMEMQYVVRPSAWEEIS